MIQRVVVQGTRRRLFSPTRGQAETRPSSGTRALPSNRGVHFYNWRTKLLSAELLGHCLFPGAARV